MVGSPRKAQSRRLSHIPRDRAGVKYVFVFANTNTNTNTAYLYLYLYLIKFQTMYLYLYSYLIDRIWCIWQIRFQIHFFPGPFSKHKFMEHKLTWIFFTSNGSWCIGIKGEMSGTVCVTFTWDIYIYMSCLLAFVCFVVCSLLQRDGICGVLCGKWQARESTGMFGNLMAIYYIMPQFIQNHSRFVMLMKTCMIS